MSAVLTNVVVKQRQQTKKYVREVQKLTLRSFSSMMTSSNIYNSGQQGSLERRRQFIAELFPKCRRAYERITRRENNSSFSGNLFAAAVHIVVGQGWEEFQVGPRFSEGDTVWQMVCLLLNEHQLLFLETLFKTYLDHDKLEKLTLQIRKSLWEKCQEFLDDDKRARVDADGLVKCLCLLGYEYLYHKFKHQCKINNEDLALRTIQEIMEGDGIMIRTKTIDKRQMSLHPMGVDRLSEYFLRLSFHGHPNLGRVDVESLVKQSVYYSGQGSEVICAKCGHTANYNEATSDKDLHKPGNPCRPPIEKTIPSEATESKERHTSGSEVILDEEDQSSDEDIDQDDLQHRMFPCQEPKSHNFVEKTARKASYSENPGWPPDFIKRLVDSGYFYNEKEELHECFYCSSQVQVWDKFDDPWIRHAEMSAHCDFLKKRKGIDFVRANAKATEPSNEKIPEPVQTTQKVHTETVGSSGMQKQVFEASACHRNNEKKLQLDKSVLNRFVEDEESDGFQPDPDPCFAANRSW